MTTGFSQHSDRQIAIWKDADLREPIKREMIDSSSGILFPYFDYDTQVLYLAGKVGISRYKTGTQNVSRRSVIFEIIQFQGDGNIRYYEVVDEPPCIHFLNQYLSDSPQVLNQFLLNLKWRVLLLALQIQESIHAID